MPRSTRAALVRSLSTLTRARGQLQALLDQASPGHPLPICSRARDELLAFDACLEESLRELVLELERPAPDIRRLEPVWAEWRREAQYRSDVVNAFSVRETEERLDEQRGRQAYQGLADAIAGFEDVR